MGPEIRNLMTNTEYKVFKDNDRVGRQFVYISTFFIGLMGALVKEWI